MSDLMTPADWKEIKHFTPQENWGDPFKMLKQYILGLDKLRAYVGRTISVHCGYEPRPTGQHPTGCASDIHIQGLHVVDQFLAAQRFAEFTGIGVYPDWTQPGLHLDSRMLLPDAARQIWGCNQLNGEQRYCHLDGSFLKSIYEVT